MEDSRLSEYNSLADVSTIGVGDDDSIVEELSLTVLFQFIKNFNGDRSELTSFIQNVNSAFSLAQPHQKPPLLLYVVSKLSTNVVNEVELSGVASWETLKTKLKLYYSHTKHLAQAHEELELIKQNPNESITDYFKRVERAKNDCIQAETINCKSDVDLPGLKKAIQQTALRRFIIHCHPSISQMLRARDIISLNEAYSLALQEEKILNYTKARVQPSQNYCSYCKTSTHSLQQCRKRTRDPPSGSQRPTYRPQDRPNNSFNNGYRSNYSHPQRYPQMENTHQSPRYSFTPRSQQQYVSQSYRQNNDQFRKRFDNPHAGHSNFNPRVNNIQTETLNCQAPMMDVPLENANSVQEAFKSLQL